MEDCFSVKIEDPQINIVEIETCIGDNIKTVEITQQHNNNVSIETCVAILPSEFSTLVDAQVSSFISGGSGILIYSNPSGMTINATPQSSGDFTYLTVNNIPVSLSGHKHTHSDILDFNTAVNSLISVKDILAGSGISISQNSGQFTVAVTGQFGLTSEQVDDRVSELLSSGSNISLAYDDQNNSLVISAYGLQPSGNYANEIHQHNIEDITNLQNELNNKQPSGIYASGTHYHISSDITDFNTSVSGLLPASFDAAVPWTPNHTLVDGTRYLINDLVYESGRLYRANYDNESIHISDTVYWTDIGPGYRLNIDGRDIPNIPFPITSVNGLVGDVELSTTDLDDFALTVSGLLPSPTFTSLSGISGVVVTSIGTDYTVSLSDASIQLANITDLPNDARTFLLTSSSTNLRSLISDDTGSGSLVFNDSPSFSGIPTAPTAPSGTNNTQIANTEFVRTEISNLVNSAPSTLDTLNELSVALGNDPNFATTIASGLSQKANLSGASFGGSISAPSGNFIVLQQNGITVSVSGHSHESADITNFDSSVSGLLPVKNILSGNNVVISSTSGDYTISASGLAQTIHEHSYTDITNFASGVDANLNTLLSGGNYITLTYDNANDSLTISASGLQPSGNYSVVGHSHTINDVSGLQLALDNKQPSGTYASGIHTHNSSDIIDFISSVSGLLPVKDLVSVTGISITNTSGVFSINSTVSGVAESASLVTTVLNKTGSLIPKFSAVYINGGQGDQPTIALASASGEAISSKTYGITAQDINNMSTGKVVVAGALAGVNTDQFNPTSPNGNVNGTILWLDPIVLGGLTKNKPFAPYHMVSIGTIIRTHQNEGVVEVRIQNGFELEELHNVAVSGVSGGQFLQYDSTNNLWIPSSSGNFSSLSISGVLVQSTANELNYLQGVVPGLAQPNKAIVSNTNNEIDFGLVSALFARDVTVKNVNVNSSLGNGIFLYSSSGYPVSDIVVDTSGGSFVLYGGAPSYSPSCTIINGRGTFKNGIILSDQSTNTIAGFNNTKQVVSLDTATYPNLLELSYLKGTTSGIQSQLENKSPIGHYHTSNEISDFDTAVSGIVSGVYQTALNNPITGVGASGYIATFDSNNTLINSIVYQSGANLGISKLNPSNKLHLLCGNVDGLRVESSNSSFLELGKTNNQRWRWANDYNSSNSLELLTGSNGNTPTTSVLTVTSLSNVGIGTSTPSGKLHVNGNGYFSNNIFINYVPVSVSGHSHEISNITDFNVGVSGLLPVTNIINGNYINVGQSGTSFTVSATGLQPSGNYANAIHNHSSSDITDFNSSVSGLVSGVYAPINSPNFSGTLSISGIPLAEVIDDEVSDLLVAGSGINLDYNDTNNALTIACDISTSLVGGSGIVMLYNETADELSINASGLSLLGHSHTFSDITDFNISVSGLISGIYAPLASPNFTGIPLAPTASSGTNTSQVATTEFVRTEISNLVNSAPTTLDTLNELASALGNDANFSTTVTNNLANKASLSGAIFSGSISAPSGNFISLLSNDTPVSVSGHNHTPADITNFAPSVSQSAYYVATLFN